MRKRFLFRSSIISVLGSMTLCISCYTPPTSFADKLKSLRWVAYSPTHFDPTITPPLLPSDADLRNDLRTLRPYFDGLITYGLTLGLDRIPVLAKQEGFKGIIVGIWDVRNQHEITTAKALAKQGIVDAICLGNEGLMTGRYIWDELIKAMTELREATQLPLTTTEAIHQYGDKRLLEMDFLLPNIHPIWNGECELNSAVQWVEQQVTALVKVGQGKPILVKETGFPSCAPYFSESLQANFYKILLSRVKGMASLAYFEAFDQPWKKEVIKGIDVGSSWGMFRTDRKPKAVVRALSPL